MKRGRRHDGIYTPEETLVVDRGTINTALLRARIAALRRELIDTPLRLTSARRERLTVQK